MTFRRNILEVCKSAIDERQRRGKASQALYAYPPDLESSPVLPSHLQDKIREMSMLTSPVLLLKAEVVESV